MGLMKEFARKFYKSRTWKKCRIAYIKHRVMADGGLCEVCREKLGYIVHHKEPLTPENIHDETITLSFANLQFECKDCHDREEAHPFIVNKKLNCCFDDSGNPMPISDTPPLK